MFFPFDRRAGARARRSILLHRFWALPRDDRVLIFRAMCLLPLFSAALVLVRAARLRRFDPSPPGPCLSGERARRIAWAVNAAADHSPIPAACLARSLVLLKMLRGEGTLRIGVRPARKGIDAHAWVEWQGAPLNDRPDIADQFAPLESRVFRSR